MKLVYVVEVNAYEDSGVNKKIRRQFRLWQQRDGLECYLVCISPRKSSHCFLEGKNFCLIDYPLSTSGILRKFHKSVAFLRLEKLLSKLRPDIVYYRFSSWTPFSIRVLGSKHTLVIEMNTDIDWELSITKTSLEYKLARRMAHKLLAHARGVIGVTPEIMRRYSAPHQEAIALANGIDVPDRLPSKANASHARRCRLVFVGSKDMPWHGVDLVYALARRLRTHDFHIVGPDQDAAASALENVFFHGVLHGDALKDLYKTADVGISSLGLFRNGMQEGCPLKSREYLAHGLPVIGAYRDPDLQGKQFFLQIPNQENGVELAHDQIVDFIERWKHRGLDVNEVRAAVDHQSKEEARLRFFESVMYNSGNQIQ